MVKRKDRPPFKRWDEERQEWYLVFPLTQGFEAYASLEDEELLRQYTWYSKVTSNGVYPRSNTTGKTGIPMHRLLMGERDADHIDRNPLNNRRYNLRKANRTLQTLNQGMRSNNNSGYKGVHPHLKGKWQARVTVKGRAYTSLHSSIDEAVEARKVLLAKHYGEWALNEGVHED